MFFAEEEKQKNQPGGQQEESHIRLRTAPYSGRGRNVSLRALGQDLHKVSRFKLHVSGSPGEGTQPLSPFVEAPQTDEKPCLPPAGQAGESAQRQGQTLCGYLTPGP